MLNRRTSTASAHAACLIKLAAASHFPSASAQIMTRFHRWLANLRILDIEELKSVPFAPRSHPFIKRLIGTLRREYSVDFVP